MKKEKTLTSALPPLTPTLITDKNGNNIPHSQFLRDVTHLVSFVKESVQQTLKNKITFTQIMTDLKESHYRVGAPVSWAAAHKYSLPQEPHRSVKAKSRILKLYQHSLVSTILSYALNPNPRKQAPNANPSINLGAVDKQMVSMNLEENRITLTLKCWENEYRLVFQLPEYVRHRSVTRLTLPTISIEQNKPLFRFTIEENIPTPKGENIGGIDLGRVEPYTLVIINSSGKRVAHYTSSGRLKQLNKKRERLLSEKKYLDKKIKAYKQLGLDATTLVKEAAYKKHKAHALAKPIAQLLGSEIANHAQQSHASTLHLENLSWVQGKKYGGRWNHSQQQEAITHANLRNGIRTKKINPKNTSQHCHKCGTQIAHNIKNRTVWCDICKTTLDRDYNAAINIAKTKTYPATNRMNGDTYRDNAQSMTQPVSRSQEKVQQIQLT